MDLALGAPQGVNFYVPCLRQPKRELFKMFVYFALTVLGIKLQAKRLESWFY